MIKSLKIQNYALIDQLEIDFNPGLTIITGETGAGKSIIIGALNLLTGAKADLSVLKDKDKKCIVEATFDIAKYNLQQFFDQNQLDYDDITIIRREINPKGRSRAFVNDTPVSLTTLKQLAAYLIDIHSQHDTLLLNNPNYQLEVLDAFAENFDLLRQYQQQYYKYRQLERQLQQLIQQAQQQKTEYDYYLFQYQQLEQAQLQPDEQELLEQEQQQLSHAEEIKNALGEITYLLTDEQLGALDKVQAAQRLAENISQYYPKAQELAQRLESVRIELQDIASEAELHFNDIEYDPQRLEQVNQRLDLIYQLQRKFNVNTVQELLDIKDEFEQRLQRIESFDEEIEKLQQQVQNQQQIVQKLAQQLSQRRHDNRLLLEKEIQLLLRQLGMPNAVFRIDIQQTDLNQWGWDKVTFFFSANKKVEPQPISRVASGGELSRLMLAIKYIVSQSKTLPTIIFDEIDTGISGQVADKVGELIKQLSKKLQVIDITHLPQIAAKADTHLLVYKEETPDGTVTRLKVLSPQERIEHIARMLSGQQVTKAALEHARHLIEQSQQTN